jgi:hypothetical protein
MVDSKEEGLRAAPRLLIDHWLLAAGTLQLCVIGATVWLPPTAKLYLQVIPAALVLILIVMRFRYGLREYRRYKALTAAHQAEMERYMDRLNP